MSALEDKLVLRAEIKELEGKSTDEVYKYFKSIIGEAGYVESEEKEVIYFEYGGRYMPVKGYNSDRWGVDYILKHKVGYAVKDKLEGNRISVRDITKILDDMESKFKVKRDTITLRSYSWYNGSEDEIDFD